MVTHSLWPMCRQGLIRIIGADAKRIVHFQFSADDSPCPVSSGGEGGEGAGGCGGGDCAGGGEAASRGPVAAVVADVVVAVVVAALRSAARRGAKQLKLRSGELLELSLLLLLAIE